MRQQPACLAVGLAVLAACSALPPAPQPGSPRDQAQPAADTEALAKKAQNPVADLIFWGKHTISERKAAAYAIPEPVATQRDEIRIEFEPQRLGFFSLYWDRKRFQTYPEKTTDNLFGEWIKPWSTRLRTRFTTNYYTTQDVYGQVSTSSYELRTNFQTLVRFNARSYATFDIGGSRAENIAGDIQYTVIPGAGFDINLFTSIYLQCNYEANVMLDSVTTHLVNAKITGQF